MQAIVHHYSSGVLVLKPLGKKTKFSFRWSFLNEGANVRVPTTQAWPWSPVKGQCKLHILGSDLIHQPFPCTFTANLMLVVATEWEGLRIWTWLWNCQRETGLVQHSASEFSIFQGATLADQRVFRRCKHLEESCWSSSLDAEVECHWAAVWHELLRDGEEFLLQDRVTY
jgi:hypothetical protein